MPISIITAAGLFLSVAAGIGPEGKADLQKLQGTWVGVAMTIDGKPKGSGVSSWRLTIKGTELKYSWPGDPLNHRISAMDPRPNPRRIELRDEQYKGGATSVPGRYKCVYTIEGDTLKLCMLLDPRDKFPSKIEKDKAGYRYFEWRKIKEK